MLGLELRDGNLRQRVEFAVCISQFVTERYRLIGDQLELNLTLVDPVYWQEPLTRTVRYNSAPRLEILDYGCDPTVSTDWRAPK